MSEPIPLEQLIGAPISALIRGESLAIEAYIAFLKEYGFNSDDPNEDEWGSLRMVSFRVIPSDNEQKPKLEFIPLLSLLPVPIVQINETEIEFFVRVHGTKPRRRKADVDVYAEYDVFGDSVPGVEQNRYPRMKIKLVTAPSDLPAGLSRALRRLDESSESIDE